MIVTLPCVDDDGVEYGGEVSFKFKDVSAIQKMHKWLFVEEGDRRRETRVVIPECCTIFLGREEFDVKADYAELLGKFKEHNEMFP